LKEYNTVLKNSKDEIIIDKSKFIGYSFHINNVDEAESFIKEIKKKHYDATHNCYAYLLKDDMSIAKASDDGEPSSTAGIPMLEVLKKENITDTLIIATRYFGGIKLGAGGLVRAYTKTAKIAIESNIIVNKKIYQKILLEIDYNFLNKIQKYIEKNDIISNVPEFMEKVRINIYQKDEYLDDLKKDILNITNGDCDIKLSGNVYLDFIGGVCKL
jgi:YigZ family protein